MILIKYRERYDEKNMIMVTDYDLDDIQNMNLVVMRDFDFVELE